MLFLILLAFSVEDGVVGLLFPRRYKALGVGAEDGIVLILDW